jgi:hypothetical protein
VEEAFDEAKRTWKTEHGEHDSRGRWGRRGRTVEERGALRAAARAAFLKAPADSLDSILEVGLGRERVCGVTGWTGNFHSPITNSLLPVGISNAAAVIGMGANATLLLLYNENSSFSCFIVSSGFATACPIVRGSL